MVLRFPSLSLLFFLRFLPCCFFFFFSALSLLFSSLSVRILLLSPSVSLLSPLLSFFLLFLPCFYRRKTGGGDVMVVVGVLPPVQRPSNTWKVVGKWCPCFGVFLSKRRKEIRRKGEEKNLLLPLPRVSRGRRRATMP